MTPIERFWLDLIDGRKHYIQTIYGTDAMQRYRPHHKEREYFINNNGRVCDDPEVQDFNQRFFAYCDERYKAEKARYYAKLEANRKKYEASSSYKALQREREELISYIRGITVRDASKEETNAHPTTQSNR